MESIYTIAGLVFGLYLIFKLNRVLTVGIGVVNTTVELADESVGVYATDVRINLAQKRKDQFDELDNMEYIPASSDINDILEGKTKPADSKSK